MQLEGAINQGLRSGPTYGGISRELPRGDYVATESLKQTEIGMRIHGPFQCLRGKRHGTMRSHIRLRPRQVKALDPRNNVVQRHDHGSLILYGYGLLAGAGRRGAQLQPGELQTAVQGSGSQDGTVHRDLPVDRRVEILVIGAGGSQQWLEALPRDMLKRHLRLYRIIAAQLRAAFSLNGCACQVRVEREIPRPAFLIGSKGQASKFLPLQRVGFTGEVEMDVGSQY